MTAREPRQLRHLRHTMSRGYVPGTTWHRPVRYLRDDVGLAEDLSGWLPPAGEAGAAGDGPLRIAFIAPTHVRRSTTSDTREWFAGVAEQLAAASEAVPNVMITVLVGMQWMAEAEEAEAIGRLQQLAPVAAAAGVRFLGLSLQGPAKVRTLNAGIRVADQLGFTAVGWFDDDVRLEPHCLAELVRDFVAHGCRGAVGATKIPHAREHVTSQLLHRAKAVATPATNYPHGCCLLVARQVVTGGIPDRYICDDGYVCFRLLDPAATDPLHDLRLVPDARCHYHVAGPARQTGRRIRRLLLNHNIYLADWSYPVARYYFRHILFSGMWPLAGWDGRQGVRHGLSKAAIKWLYFGWFSKISIELYLRGLLRRPLDQIDWAEDAAPEAPRAALESALTKVRA